MKAAMVLVETSATTLSNQHYKSTLRITSIEEFTKVATMATPGKNVIYYLKIQCNPVNTVTNGPGGRINGVFL